MLLKTALEHKKDLVKTALIQYDYLLRFQINASALDISDV